MVFAAALLVVLAAGCGGSSNPSVSEYTPEASTTMRATGIAKPQFIRRVNQICRGAWNDIRMNVARHRRSLDPGLSRQQRLDDVIRTPVLFGVVFHIFDAIRILGSPPGEEQEIEAIVGPMQAASELGQDGRPTLHSIAEVEDHYSLYNRRARAYGLDDCTVTEAHLHSIERPGA